LCILLTFLTVFEKHFVAETQFQFEKLWTRTMSSLKTLLRTFSTMTNRSPGVPLLQVVQVSQIEPPYWKKGGSAVDAAIASMLGEGVAVPNTMGLGGGFNMTVYIKDKRGGGNTRRKRSRSGGRQ
jgi:hypothetical protein